MYLPAMYVAVMGLVSADGEDDVAESGVGWQTPEEAVCKASEEGGGSEEKQQYLVMVRVTPSQEPSLVKTGTRS